MILTKADKDNNWDWSIDRINLTHSCNLSHTYGLAVVHPTEKLCFRCKAKNPLL